MILLVAFLQIHHSDLEHHAANDFWSSLAPSLSSFASSSSPQHSWVKMLVYRVSVPPTSPTSNKPHITTNVLQNLISIVTKSVKTKGDILACIIFKLSFAVWHDRVTCYVNICAMLSCLKIVFIQFISLIGRDFDFQRWNICCRYSKRKIKSRDGETFSINWKSKDNHPTTCPSVFFSFPRILYLRPQKNFRQVQKFKDSSLSVYIKYYMGCSKS